MYLKTKNRCVALLTLAFIVCVSMATLAFSGEHTAFAFGSGVFKNAEKNQYNSLDFEDETEITGWAFDSATKSRSDSDWFAVETTDKYYHSGSKIRFLKTVGSKVRTDSRLRRTPIYRTKFPHG